jgi:hypothetical protein
MTYVTYGLKVAATLSIEMIAPGFGMVVAAFSMMYDEVKALNMDDKILEIVVMGLEALMNNDGKVTSGGNPKPQHFCKNFPDMNITLMIVKTENRPLYQKITRVWNIVAQAVQQAEKQNSALDFETCIKDAIAETNHHGLYSEMLSNGATEAIGSVVEAPIKSALGYVAGENVADVMFTIASAML